MICLEQLVAAWPLEWKQLGPGKFRTEWDDHHNLTLLVRGDYLRAVLERRDGLRCFRIARGLGTTIAAGTYFLHFGTDGHARWRQLRFTATPLSDGGGAAAVSGTW